LKRILGKPTADIVYADLERLVVEGEAWREGRSWDFKASVLADPSAKKDHRKELLADVSSFANADGGIIVIGVSAKQGVPSGLPGIPLAELDALQLRLQALAREHLDPPLTRLVPHVVQGPAERGFLLLEIPRSLLGPHTVWLDRDGRFWKRNTGGKYQMDITELREAFLEADRWLDGANATRTARTREIAAGRYASYGFPAGFSVLVVHSIPLGRSRTRFDIDSVTPLWKDHFHPDSELLYTYRHTVDGGLVFANTGKERAALVHCLRNGTVELCVLLHGRYSPPEKPDFIDGCRLEADLGSWLEAIFKWQRAAGLEPPIACFVTLLSVNGRNFAVRHPWGGGEPTLPFDDRDVELPEVVLNDQTPSEWSTVFREVAKLLWQTAGLPESPC